MSVALRLKGFLDENHIPYSVMTHTTAYTAQGAAATMQISGKELAKSVVLRAGEEMVLAVLPALNHVRLDKLAAEVGKSVCLATEQEFSSLFPDCEPGAMPPFGSLYNLPVYVDESLAADEEIVFNGGTHRDAIRMRYDDFVRLARPKVCSFAQTDTDGLHLFWSDAERALLLRDHRHVFTSRPARRVSFLSSCANDNSLLLLSICQMAPAVVPISSCVAFACLLVFF